MDELLQTWNLPQLSALFQEQEITIDALEALTDADIAELIPKVGPRALFRKRLTEWLNTTPALPTVEATAAETTDEHDEDTQFYEEIESNGEEFYLTNELDISNEVEIDNQHCAEHITEVSIETEVSKASADTCEEEFLDIDYLEPILKVVEPNDFKQRENNEFNDDLAKNEGTEDIIQLEIRRESSTTTVNEESGASTLRYLNVKEILLGSKEGRAIIEKYEWNPHVDKQTRLFITDLIISEVFAMNLVLDRARFQEIAAQIVEIFPNENIQNWYVAHNSKSRNSGGTLFNKYYSVYRKMRKTGFYTHYIEGLMTQLDNDSMEDDAEHFAIVNPEQINDDEPDKLALKRAIPKYERLRRSCDFQRIHVMSVLESSFEGRGIIEFFKKHQRFDAQTRNRLCKLVVMEALKRKIKMRPRDFYDISCQIVERFSTESIDVYFLPRGRTPPKGCLYHKYLYIKRRLRKMGLGKKGNEQLYKSIESENLLKDN